MTAVCIGLMSAGSVAADQAATTSKFLKLGEAERYWYLEGAMRTVSHLLSLQSKAIGNCAGKWYLSDRDNKRRVIEAAIAKHPEAGETTIILGLLEQACGPLVPK